GCDMSGWVRLAGVPTVIYGPGEIELAHAPNESVSLEATYRVARTLVKATERLLEIPVDELRPPSKNSQQVPRNERHSVN
ncbi:acetylornithine deacetylase, partial [Wenzhouxiangella sp. 15181]